MRLKGFTQYYLVYTKAASNGYLFFPFPGVLDTTDMKYCRPAISVYACSGSNIELVIGWQASDDGESGWPNSSTTTGTIGGGTLAAATADGTTFATAFEDISSGLVKKYVRFGVRTKNTAASPTVPEFALVAIRLEFKRA